MTAEVQLFSVTPAGPLPLPVPPGAESVYDLFDSFPGGVYTSFCTFDHDKFLHLEDHLERLASSMAQLGWDFQLDRHSLRRALHQVCTDFPGQNARVRLDVLAEPAGVLGDDSRTLISLSEIEALPEELYRRGVRAGIARRLSRQQPRIKKAEFVRQRRSYLDRDPGLFDYLLVDRRGHLLEGTTSNFYGIRSGTVYTAGEGVLEGVARKVVLYLVGELEIPVIFSPVREHEISELDEAALSSSSRALLPVVEIDGRTVADGRPGAVTKELLAAYRAYQAREIRTAIDA